MLTNIITLFFLIFLNQLRNFKCSKSSIENCEEFEIINDEEFCTKCKDKHFPFFNNLYCFPCDNELYGQIGCGGNCDSSRYKEERIVYCNPNECKEGYDYLNGLCINCTKQQPGCKTCNITENINNNGQKDYYYECIECLSNEYILDEKKCKKCSTENCIQCHYNDFDLENKECDKCYEDYYWSNYTKTCKKCSKININNGYCQICSDNEPIDYNSLNCFCNYYYGFNQNKSCLECGENCLHCNISLENNIECTSCHTNSALHEKNKNCLKCSPGCDNCLIVYDKETACRKCYYDNFLKDYNNCIECLPEMILVFMMKMINVYAHPVMPLVLFLQMENVYTVWMDVINVF